MPADLDAEVQRIGRELAAAFPSAARHPMRAIDARAMDATTQDADLRAALFRFVDVVPACRSLDELSRHLVSYLDEVGDRPPPLAAAMRAAKNRAGRAALGAASAAGVRHTAHRFIVGESPADAMPSLRSLWKQGIASSLDLLGETTVTAAEADRYADRCAATLRELTTTTQAWPARARLEADSAGPLPRANLSVKVSALTPLLRAQAPERGRADTAPRLRALFALARDTGAHLHVDMESLDSREAVLDLVLELLSETEFADGPSAGIVLQAYLRDSPAQLDQVSAWARDADRSTPLTIRLVKGAYWDHEVIEARQHGWPVPVFEDKADCDRNFESLTRTLVGAPDGLRVAIASHNLRSVAYAIAVNRAAGRDDGDLELQVLRGLGDDLAEALSAQGLRVRSYCPVGDLVAGMAYLVRRLLENTANESFLADAAKGAPLDELLAAP